jgi:outer membrane protein OmpA-like peptidoglycan-associated protein
VRNVPPGDLTDALNHDPAAISIVSLSAPAGKVLGLRPDASGPPVRPSQQSVIRGSYPLYHDVYLHSAGAKNKAATDFLAWVISPAGQDLVDEQRFVPLFLRPERLDTPRPLRETIHFEVGEIKPNQRSSARIELLTGELQERAGEYHHIVLEGFTDTTEPNPTALSRARAEMVRDRLKTALPGLYFEIIPRGAMRPIAPNNTPYGRQRNRRVQIYLADEEAKGLGQGSETEEG